MPGSREAWLKRIKDTPLGRFIIISDQQPRRWYMGADIKIFESDAWKMWAEDYAQAYNELDESDLEYLENADYEAPAIWGR
jgi:hypothetical protein